MRARVPDSVVSNQMLLQPSSLKTVLPSLMIKQLKEWALVQAVTRMISTNPTDLNTLPWQTICSYRRSGHLTLAIIEQAVRSDLLHKHAFGLFLRLQLLQSVDL